MVIVPPSQDENVAGSKHQNKMKWIEQKERYPMMAVEPGNNAPGRTKAEKGMEEVPEAMDI